MNKLRNFIHTYGNAYFFIGFWLILFVFFTLIPILMAVVISFTNFDMVQAPRFIGFSNYMRMFFDDDVFLIAVPSATPCCSPSLPARSAIF